MYNVHYTMHNDIVILNKSYIVLGVGVKVHLKVKGAWLSLIKEGSKLMQL